MRLSASKDVKRMSTLLDGYQRLKKDGVIISDNKRDSYFFAGIKEDGKRRIFSLKVLSFILGLSLSALLTTPFFLLIPLITVIFIKVYLSKKAFKRSLQFEKDYPALLLSLSSSIKTGADPFFALKNAGSLFPEESITREELKKVSGSVESGASEERAILEFASSIKHPDLKLFRTAFILARTEGSSLSTCLERLAKVTRTRQSFRRKVRGAVAMQKLSSFGIGGCAVFIGFVQVTSNKDAFFEAISHPLGAKILSFGLLLILSGMGWMYQMTRQRV